MATQPSQMRKDSRHCESRSDVAIHVVWSHGLFHFVRNDDVLS